MSIFELRVALTTEAFDRLVAFYRDGLGLEPGDMWTDNGQGQILMSGFDVVSLQPDYAVLRTSNRGPIRCRHVLEGIMRDYYREAG